ncbi:MAG TPA: triple tyrosine motif-containing protein, partial [Phnomibacter sp.]|nr:triple tyrosine motif-containing protein [Phnomibacter sp.]
KFISYDTEKPGSERLPEEQVRQMVGLPSGKIWVFFEQTSEIGLFDPKAITYHKAKIVTRGSLPPRAEFTLWADSRGDVYLNVLRYGKILRFDSSRFEFNENTPLNGIPDGWKCAAVVHEDTLKQRYWIITNKGLCIYDLKTKRMWSRLYNPEQIKLLEFFNPYHEYSEFFIDSKRRHWFFYWTTQQNFLCFNEDGQPLPDTSGLNGVNTGYSELRRFTETSDGTLWVYGAGCLYTLDKEKKKFDFYRSQYTDNYNIRYENIPQVIEDRDGVIWIATDQGLYYHTPRKNKVANIYLSEKPGYYEVTDLVQLSNKSYMVSTWGRGILTMDSSFRYYDEPVYSQMPSMSVEEKNMYKQTWSLLKHSNGKIFIGCQGGRLMIYDPGFKRNTFLAPAAFENRTIRYIAEDNSGKVWFGTQGGALVMYDGKEFTLKLRLEETAIIYKVAIDPSTGWIWIATHERGLYVFNPGTGKIEMHFVRNNGPQSLHGNRVTDLEHLNDSMLVATASGVLHIINKYNRKVAILDKEQGLPSNTAIRVRLDSKGYIWFITQLGLCHYDPLKNKFTSFGQKDGIFLGEMVHACDLIDEHQNLLFAGPNALLAFHPDAFYNSPKPGPVVITDFKLLDKYLPVDSLLVKPWIRLRPGENAFSIYFSSLSYRNRGQFTYYYKLEGADKDWVKANADQSAQYRLLPAGKYVFKVKVENLDGISNETITSINIYVKPHFWQTGWFISFLLMVVGMVAFAMHRLRLNKILAVEKIRGRVSRDLHDDMGSTLSTINILSSMAKAKLSVDQPKAAEYLAKISDNSQRMMEAMDDIVWAIKPDNDTMLKLIARMREFATSVLEAKEMQLEFVADEALNNLKPDMEYRRDLFLLFKEAVNNAAKYSKSKAVNICIGIDNHRLKMVVADNGVGFDAKTADSGNGLGNMRRRAAALHGKLDITSRENFGTTITLVAPLVV